MEKLWISVTIQIGGPKLSKDESGSCGKSRWKGELPSGIPRTRCRETRRETETSPEPGKEFPRGPEQRKRRKETYMKGLPPLTMRANHRLEPLRITGTLIRLKDLTAATRPKMGPDRRLKDVSIGAEKAGEEVDQR